jgi:hypothetical protein
VFDCVTDGESYTIRKVVVEKFSDEFDEDDEEEGPGGDDEDNMGFDPSDLDQPMEPYRGPIFENLDPELQVRIDESTLLTFSIRD